MKKVAVTIPYGDDEVTLELPTKNILCISSPNDVPGVENEKEEVLRAIKKPFGCQSLFNNIKRCNNVIIISDDNTRITPVHLIIPACLDQLNKIGVEDGDIRVITALGTHRRMTDKEIKEKVGSEVSKRVEIGNHDFQNHEKLVDLGITPQGTPISINKDVLEADFVIGIGNIVPHHIPGWAGGAKIIQPGVSGEVTTAETHLLGVRQSHSLLGETENVVRSEMEMIAQKAGLKAIINTILNREGRIVRVVAGDPIKAFREGVKEARKVCEVSLPARADIVLSGSHPCDIEFWQAGKSLYSSDLAVKDNGTIIVVTPCFEGVSKMHPEVIDFAGLPSKEIDRRVRSREIEDGTAAALAMAWAMVRERAEIILVSEGISPSVAAKLGFKSVDSAEKALEMAFKKHGLNAKISVLTHAPEVLPSIKDN
ncbi:MAG: lactate racemase [Thermoproteota archaeon]|nr:lactate racemase [Thermoproteota archaeon]